MFDLIFGGPPRKATTGDGWYTGPWYSNRIKTQAGVVVDEELSLTYGAVWSACRALTDPLATLPIGVFSQDDDGHLVPATDLPQYDLLRYQPNPIMGQTAFWEGRSLHQINFGNGFAEIERDAMNRPVGLWPIHPGRVKPKQPGDRYVNGLPIPDGSYLVRMNDGGHVVIEAQDMLHIHGCHSEDGIWGKGVVQYARECIGFGLGTERHGATQFGSGNVSRMVLTDPSLKDREKRRQFRTEWKEIHGSPDSGEIVVLANRDAKLDKLSFSATDNQFLETRQFNTELIATWYRVPLHMLMVKDSGSEATVEQQAMEFVLYSLLPLSKRQEDQLTLKLFTAAQRRQYVVQRQFDGLLRAVDLQTRMTAYRVAIMIGVMKVNECRRLEGLPRDPDGDKLMFPSNMATLNAIVQGMVAGRKGSSPSGQGSEQSGTPADDQPDTGFPGGFPQGDQESQARAFWARKSLRKTERQELWQQLKKIERLLVAAKSHAALPSPAMAAAGSAAPAATASPARSAPGSTAESQAPAVQQGAALIEVPDIRQPDHYSCGASAAMAVGRYFGVGPASIDEWKDALRTSLEFSTRPRRIVDYLSQLGLVVTATHNLTIEDLRGWWLKGCPVIVCVQDYGGRREEGAAFLYGHYLTVIGVNVGYVFCQDSSLENADHVPGGDVPPAEADNTGNIAAPGRLMVDFDTWLANWHDIDADGNKFIRFGIAVGPQVHPDEPAPSAPAPLAQRPAAGPAAPARQGVQNSALSRDAARVVLTDALARMFGKEAHAAGRAVKGEHKADFQTAWLPRFYGEKHLRTLAAALGPACQVLAAAGIAADADGLAVRLAGESRRLLAEAYDRETPAGFAAMLETWPTARAAAAADATLEALGEPTGPAGSRAS